MDTLQKLDTKLKKEPLLSKESGKVLKQTNLNIN